MRVVGREDAVRDDEPGGGDGAGYDGEFADVGGGEGFHALRGGWLGLGFREEREEGGIGKGGSGVGEEGSRVGEGGSRVGGRWDER